MVHFICAVNDLIPVENHNIRWLEKDADYELARHHWQAWGQVLSFDTWNKAHEYGFQYAGIIERDKIVSSAGVWRFSEKCWEVAAVGTLENYRRRGYAKSLVAFIATYIHKLGRLATCTTNDENIAMIATAESVGFKRFPETEVWWCYPNLPDF